MSFLKQHSKSILNRNEAIYVCDENGYIKLFNKAAAQLWGREPEINKDLYCGSLKLFDVSGKILNEDEYPVAKIISNNQAIESVNLKMMMHDGKYKKILQSSTPIFNQFGELTGTINLVMEVTE